MVSVVRRSPDRRADMDGCWALEKMISEWWRADEGVVPVALEFESEGSILTMLVMQGMQRLRVAREDVGAV